VIDNICHGERGYCQEKHKRMDHTEPFDKRHIVLLTIPEIDTAVENIRQVLRELLGRGDPFLGIFCRGRSDYLTQRLEKRCISPAYPDLFEGFYLFRHGTFHHFIEDSGQGENVGWFAGETEVVELFRWNESCPRPRVWGSCIDRPIVHVQKGGRRERRTHVQARPLLCSMEIQELVNFIKFHPHTLFDNIRPQALDFIYKPGEFPVGNVTGDFPAGMADQAVSYAQKARIVRLG